MKGRPHAGQAAAQDPGDGAVNGGGDRTDRDVAGGHGAGRRVAGAGGGRRGGDGDGRRGCGGSSGGGRRGGGGGGRRGRPGRGGGRGRRCGGGGGDHDDNDDDDNDLPEYQDRWGFRLENIAKQPIQADNPPRITIGEMDNECQHCHALLFPGENLSLCCMNGNAQLPAELPLPEKLLNLYQTGDENSRLFRQNIRSYNNHFSFASMQYNLQPPPGRGGFVFHICRQIGHRVGPLHPGQNENRHYGQLYIYDPNVAVQQRIQNNGGFDANINP